MSGLEEFLKRAEKANVVPVIETMSADLLTPLAVYLKLADDQKESFLLESVEGGESLARYSFVGVDPEFTVSGNSGRVRITDKNGSRTVNQSMIGFLRDHFERHRLVEDDELPSFAGGAIGSLGFSCSAWFEPSLRPSIEETDDEAAFMFCRTIVAFDHAKQVIKIVTLVFVERETGRPRRDAYTDAVAANSRVRLILEKGTLNLPAAPIARASAALVRSNFEKSAFQNAVRTIKEMIAAGDAYQVVLSQCFSRPTEASPIAIYRAMRSLNPSPYMFLIRMDGQAIIG
ncbi:MAG: chorismate-binding protein, partial [Acidobacteriota bacterium]